MKNFNDRSSGGRNFSRGGGDRDRRFDSKREGRPEMFKAICADCGKPCEIPFKPNNSRPVFCSTCFSDHGNEGSDRSDFQKKEMFDATCDKCGKRCEVPFKPVSGKPVFCSLCFDRDNGGRDSRDGGRDRAPRPSNFRDGGHDHGAPVIKNNDQYKEQFEKLNAKLDMILNSLKPNVSLELKKEKVSIETKKEEEKIKSIEKKGIKAKTPELKVSAVKAVVAKKIVAKKVDKKRKK
jgi:CxxC-x17-CxxC domain-containing protein